MDFNIYVKELIDDKKITSEELQAMRLVAKLVKVRKDKKITQKELSKKSGLTQSAISKFENYEQTPNLETFLRISGALDVPLNIGEETQGYAITSELDLVEMRNTEINKALKEISKQKNIILEVLEKTQQQKNELQEIL